MCYCASYVTKHGRELPCIQGRGGGQEELSHAQGVVAVRAQEGLEEPSTLKVRKDGGRR